MAIATQAQILKVLKAFNPWWVTGAVHPDFTKHYRRFAYYEAMKRLEQRDLRRTVVLTGTRRVGKTTIQYQMIDTLLKRGVPPQRIVFISLDHPMLKLSGLAHLVPDGQTILLVSLLATCTPSASTITQMAQIYGTDADYASAINVVTTLLCIFTMPLMVALYQL